MRVTRVGTALAAAAALLAAIAACSNGANRPSANPSSSQPPAPIQTAESPTQIASDSATTTVRTYYSTLDRLGQQPQLPLGELDSVAISVQLSAERNLLNGWRTAGEKQLGDTKVVRGA